MGGIVNEGQEEFTDNSEFIYAYAERSIQSVNKSIDNVVFKTNMTLCLSVLCLKFAADTPSDGIGFSFKVGSTLCLLMAVAFGITGIYPKAAGNVISTRYLRENSYYTPDEELRRMIIDQNLTAIDQLNELAKYRRQYLYASLISFGVAVFLFGIEIVINTTPLTGLQGK